MPGLASAARLIGSGIRQESVSGRSPAGSDIGQPVEDERGFTVNVFLTVNRPVARPGSLRTLVDDASLSEHLEGNGVAAAFGEEMAAETEHVRPAGKGFPG